MKKYTDEPGPWVASRLQHPRAGLLLAVRIRSSQVREEVATKAREVRAELGMSKSPLYLMFMSNGGCWSHATMTQCMLEPGGEFEDLGPHLKGRCSTVRPPDDPEERPEGRLRFDGRSNTAARAVHALFYVYAVVAFLVVVARRVGPCTTDEF